MTGGREKKGFDKGIDGIKVFVDDNSGKAKRVIVQVKSGHVRSGDSVDLGYAARCAEKLCFSELFNYLRGYAADSDGRHSRDELKRATVKQSFTAHRTAEP
ncbi:hypothetical protein BH10ACI3_BH10ACI3_18440 [soil metagenome]